MTGRDRGRWLPALRDVVTSWDSDPPPLPAGRDTRLAVALARLETCARRRDAHAAQRVLDGLPSTDDGAWLLVQMAAAGFRALGAGTQQLPPAAAVQPPQPGLSADSAHLTATVVPHRRRRT